MREHLFVFNDLRYLMSFPEPPSPKSSVRAAGKAIADNIAKPEDFARVEQWRSAHGYALNTFKVWFRRKFEKQDIEVDFAQRLKRGNTVIDKLRRKRPDGTPLIFDVTTMQDFADCRLIFNNIQDLVKFRSYILSSDVLGDVRHRLKHSYQDKYNYIEHPKTTGYRGIHDVFLHHPRPHRIGDDHSKPWQGLMVEVQYRTRPQHAWATALEISDILDREKTKFGFGEDKRGQFFAMASEMIARRHEGLRKAYLDFDDNELEKVFFAAEDELLILRRLGAVRLFEEHHKLRKHNVLNIVEKQDGDYGLEVEAFRNAQDAIARTNELENKSGSINAVYVTGEPAQLRNAYRNYFNDPVDFVRLLER